MPTNPPHPHRSHPRHRDPPHRRAHRHRVLPARRRAQLAPLGPVHRHRRPRTHRPARRPHPIRLGRRQLHVALSSPDAPYWVRYRLTGGPARTQHTAEVTLSPTEDGGTDLHWRATPTRHLPGTGRRRIAALEAAVAGVAAQLASAAEDPATTRAEWAHARHDVAAAPLRSLTAVPAGDAAA